MTLRFVALAVVLLSTTARAQAPDGARARCRADMPPFSSPFCAELVAVPELATSGVSGLVTLDYVRSPFGVAVTREGRLRHRITLDLSGLPAPSSLGAFTAYYAWGYSLTMDGEIRLGVVRNGRNVLIELPYEQFRIVVSAEASPAPPSRRGKIVLRATSPSALLLAHRDAIMPMAAATAGGRPDTAAHHQHGASAWPEPPADPRIAPSAMAHPPPSTAPWLPSAPTASVRDARPREVRSLRSGDTLDLEAGIVRRTIGARTVLMYGYNGQYPGPLIRVGKGTEILVRFRNALDQPSTIHWHGIRLDNRFDGVPDLTQAPVAPGDSFTYRVRFPDAGIYWYHPHVREDVQQELGLYGNILVSPASDRRDAVNREEVLALDDVLVGAQGLFPFGRDVPSHALMGRFGNVLLVNGEPSYSLGVRQGEVIRLYLTNVANARVMNLSFEGARVKLVGTDVGRFERQEWVESVVIAPAERYIVDVRYPRAGKFAITSNARWLDHMRGTFQSVRDTLGIVTVASQSATPNHSSAFTRLARDSAVTRELRPFRAAIARSVDHTLTLGLRARNLSPAIIAMLTGVAVPMDWNDAMPSMNWALTGNEVTWTLTDERGRENMDVAWRFREGDVVKVRLINDPTVMHAMAHPIHIHGQRFLVVSRNGVPNDNLAWKDTAVLPAGETMDILLELSNPGRWMLHCHVAEHLGTGMMTTFTVDPRDGSR